MFAPPDAQERRTRRFFGEAVDNNAWLLAGLDAYQADWVVAMADFRNRSMTTIDEILNDSPFVVIWTRSRCARIDQVARHWAGQQGRPCKPIIVRQTEESFIFLTDGGLADLPKAVEVGEGVEAVRLLIQDVIREATRPQHRPATRPTIATRSGARVNATSGRLAHNPFAVLADLGKKKS
jgi:hypothetical protein